MVAILIETLLSGLIDRHGLLYVRDTTCRVSRVVSHPNRTVALGLVARMKPLHPHEVTSSLDPTLRRKRLVTQTLRSVNLPVDYQPVL